jgi:DNA-binding LytR/AlgR family response regulator
MGGGNLVGAWALVLIGSAVYCSLYEIVLDRPMVELGPWLQWGAKVWTAWIVLSIALRQERVRAVLAPIAEYRIDLGRMGQHRLGLAGILVCMPLFALACECAYNAAYALIGWWHDPAPVVALVLRRAPLYVIAPVVLAYLNGLLERRRSVMEGAASSSVSGTTAHCAPASQAASDRPAPILAPAPHASLAITLSTAKGPVDIAVPDIEAIVAAENYVEICLSDGRQYLHRATLQSFGRSLNAGTMIQVRRSAIVNLAHLRERLSGERLRLTSGRIVRVGRTYKERVAEALDRRAV